MRAITSFVSALRTFPKDGRAAIAPIVALSMVVLAGVAALAVDIGRAFSVQRSLQFSSDAAALATLDINCCSTAPGTAITTANSYSAISGGRNASSQATVTMVSGYPQLKCLTSAGILCSWASISANAIVVKQQATVPMYFAQILASAR